MPDFVTAAKVSEISEGEGKAVKVGGKDIAIFNVEGEFYAIDDACRHKGGLLGEGMLDGNIVTCPWHHWQYNVMTGISPTNLQIKVETYEVKVEGDKIKVKVE